MSRNSDLDNSLRPWIAPLVLGVAVFSLLALTASHYGLALDETMYFYASELEFRWFAQFIEGVMHGDPSDALRDENINAAWRSNPFNVPHPPFSRILSVSTRSLFSGFVDKFTAYRIAPVFLFTILATAMYVWMARLFNRNTGLFAALTLVIIPNVFAYAHIANTDMPLTVLWFLTVYCFCRGLQSWRWSLTLGLVWGLALATKFPAFLIPFPLLFWAHIYHRRAYTNNLFAMMSLSPVVMIALQPYLWHQTLPRLTMFLYDSVSRGFREETNFLIYFLGAYHFTNTLPWYYALFMIAIIIPETILASILVGMASLLWIKTGKEVMTLFLGNVIFVLLLGLFPGAVLHDANRLLLPAFPFLAGLGGCGFFFLASRTAQWCHRIKPSSRIHRLEAKIIGVLFFLLLVPPAIDVILYHPFELSYYNRMVGGIRGAQKLGLETTQLMEALTPDFLDFLNRELPPNAVLSGGGPRRNYNYMFEYYQMENRLREDLRITNQWDFDYYILLNRKSILSEFDKVLLSGSTPYAAVQLQGVPLILLYKR